MTAKWQPIMAKDIPILGIWCHSIPRELGPLTWLRVVSKDTRWEEHNVVGVDLVEGRISWCPDDVEAYLYVGEE